MKRFIVLFLALFSVFGCEKEADNTPKMSANELILEFETDYFDAKDRFEDENIRVFGRVTSINRGNRYDIVHIAGPFVVDKSIKVRTEDDQARHIKKWDDVLFKGEVDSSEFFYGGRILIDEASVFDHPYSIH